MLINRTTKEGNYARDVSRVFTCYAEDQIRGTKGVVLSDDTEPKPDISVVKPRRDCDRAATPEDVYLQTGLRPGN